MAGSTSSESESVPGAQDLPTQNPGKCLVRMVSRIEIQVHACCAEPLTWNSRVCLLCRALRVENLEYT